MASWLAAPATSRNAPAVELVETPAIVAVPVKNRLPLASGVPAVGRTRILPQASLSHASELAWLTVNVIWLTVRVGVDDKSVTSFLLPEPGSPIRVMVSVGAVP